MYSISKPVLGGWALVFLSPPQLKKHFMPGPLRILSAWPNVSVQRDVSDKTVRFMFSVKKIVESRCCILRAALYRATSSRVAPIGTATDTNLQTTATKPELFWFVDFVEVSRNLFSVHLDATDGGQKPVTFGIDEIVSLLDSQVKCEYAVFSCWEGIIGELNVWDYSKPWAGF